MAKHLRLLRFSVIFENLFRASRLELCLVYGDFSPFLHFAILKDCMNRDFFIKLNSATHRIADLLPEGELKYSLKRSANNILCDLILITEENPITQTQKKSILPRAFQEFEVLHGYLEQAKEISAGKPENFLILQREYSKIKPFLGDFERETKSLSERQEKIVEILKHKEKAQVWELQKILPQVTKRTLRRDLDGLLRLRLIERIGAWNAVFYCLKK